MATFSIRVTSEEDKLVRTFAKVKGVSLNELFKEAVLEQIEEEIDLAAYNKALEEFNENPVTYTHEEVLKELGIG